MTHPGSNRADQRHDWRLHAVRYEDLDGLHALACEPLVYRYLFDGLAPERDMIQASIANAIADAARTKLGMWILDGARAPCAGCVQLRPDASKTSAEIFCLLHPDHWQQGLATRMAWTAMARAFQEGIERVVAGADGANTDSVAVMQRLRMRFCRQVQYPLGPGVEYQRLRGDPLPSPEPELLPLD